MSTEIADPTKKSTNVRFEVPAPMRYACATLSRLSPPLASRVAANLFCRPHRTGWPSRAREALAPALATADPARIEAVLDRYPLSTPAREALPRLAELAFERGGLVEVMRTNRGIGQHRHQVRLHFPCGDAGEADR